MAFVSSSNNNTSSSNEAVNAAHLSLSTAKTLKLILLTLTKIDKLIDAVKMFHIFAKGVHTHQDINPQEWKSSRKEIASVETSTPQHWCHEMLGKIWNGEIRSRTVPDRVYKFEKALYEDYNQAPKARSKIMWIDIIFGPTRRRLNNAFEKFDAREISA
ncbi:hypothetical protein Tco_0530817 [Tanacetum coccineum]